MRKYGKLIVLTLLIIGVISTFYITNLTNVKKLPQFEIHTVSGDEKIKDNIVVKGTFGFSTFNEDLFRYEDNETIYGRQKSFITRNKLFYDQPEIIDLQNRFRNFMRGKDNYNINTFYENDQYIAYGNVIYDYAGLGDYKFEIDVLNKDTKKNISFTHGIPNRNDYWSFELAHVQLIDDELHIVTINDFTDGDIVQEARLYTFDLNKRELINDELVFELDETKSGESYSYMSVIERENPHDSSMALYIEQTDMIIEDEEKDMYSEKVVNEQVVLFDLKDKSIHHLDLLKEFDKVGTPFYIDDQSLYFGTTFIKQLDIKKYDLTENKIKKELVVETNVTDVARDNIVYGKVADGKLYYSPSFSTEYTENPTISVIDLVDMKTLYEGYLQLKDGPITREMYLYLDPLEVK